MPQQAEAPRTRLSVSHIPLGWEGHLGGSTSRAPCIVRTFAHVRLQGELPDQVWVYPREVRREDRRGPDEDDAAALQLLDHGRPEPHHMGRWGVLDQAETHAVQSESGIRPEGSSILSPGYRPTGWNVHEQRGQES